MRPYTNPYLAGVGIGVVLLAAFLIMGRGLGASGAFTTVVSSGVATASPAHAATNDVYTAFAGEGVPGPLRDWLVIEILGVTLGGLLSAWAAGRFRVRAEHGPRVTSRQRLAFAFAGGTVMGFGARLARGCTSGLALTGGAALGVGAWIFIAAAFAAGYAVAPLVRRQWA